MLDEALIRHISSERLRIRIPSQRGNRDYFSSLVEEFARLRPFKVIQANPLTGSILFVEEELDVQAIADYGKNQGAFLLQAYNKAPVPLSRRLVQPLRDVSETIERTSGGELDLPGLAFLGLLGVGVLQIMRGNFGAPPWYTAFWYAMGIFTKSLTEKAVKNNTTF